MNDHFLPFPLRVRIRLRLLGFLFGALFLCRADAAEPLRVMVSIKPVHSLVSALMEGTSAPQLLIQRDELPWHYRPDTQTQRELADADLVIWTGPELEAGLDRALNNINPRGRILELLDADALKVLPARDSDEGRDPWFWLDTRNMLIFLDMMTHELGRLDPERSHLYQRNRLRILGRLSQLDGELEYGYRGVSGTPVLLYHDTQQYFEQAYALKVAAYALNPGEDPPSTAQLLSLRALLGEQPVPCLFVEAGVPAPHLDLVLGNSDARVVKLNSLGTQLPAGPDLYEQVLRSNYSALRSCAASDKDAGDGSRQTSEFTVPSHRIQTRYLLEDHTGASVTNLDFPDQYQLIYFGYTYCPDICPTSLATVTGALNLLGNKAEHIQPLFISVDPARDTPEVLRNYTRYFHPRLLGLSGSEEMVARVAKGFRVQYEKVVSDSDPERYFMDHTSSTFLLGPDGAFVAKFAHGIPAEELARRLETILSEVPQP